MMVIGNFHAIVDADKEHDNNEAAIDAHVIDPESEADGVFQNAIEEVKRTSGCEGDRRELLLMLKILMMRERDIPLI